ncbi:hypothetical protein [Klenkia taihuensis]|uniref:Uncharacterized protein n=1 Tax=Klenkia taihuensis TaxID=1225127 RepID=A0A1I1U1F1_9ACTN|nr:hypothetical protein [Klenkia taihuensis]GHE06989.1 hypothetical protein GCM10011381_01280 [Klenkia taihuensis]SFD64589.1 hypothetical protein SAMN05661030_3873 [Klenkia taihuensis]
MQIALDPTDGSTRLEHADVFTKFSVVVPTSDSLPLRADEVPEQLGWATPDGEHVFVRIEALTQLAGDRAADPDWTAGLDGMLAYARTSGWTSPDGTAVRAHCTTSEGTGPTG